MATQIITTITDDLDGSPDAHPCTFDLDGVTYAIDLTDEHQDELREALAPFIQAGTRTGGKRAAYRKPKPNNPTFSAKVVLPADPKTIRAWWKANEAAKNLPGWKSMGKIPAVVMEAWHQSSVS